MFDKVFIVAELSANHNGNIDTAIETIKAAKRAGADAIKLQSYTPDAITINSKKEDFLIKGLYGIINIYMIYIKWHIHHLNGIANYLVLTKSEDTNIFSSPFDIKSVDLLESFETHFYKIASPEISDIPLIVGASKR